MTDQQQKEGYEPPSPEDVAKKVAKRSLAHWKEILIVVLLIILCAYFGLNLIWFVVAAVAWFLA